MFSSFCDEFKIDREKEVKGKVAVGVKYHSLKNRRYAFLVMEVFWELLFSLRAIRRIKGGGVIVYFHCVKMKNKNC